MALWEEKLALRPTFAGNAATAWGTVSEDTALQRCAGSCASFFTEGCIAVQGPPRCTFVSRSTFSGSSHATAMTGTCIARSSMEVMRIR